MEQLILQCKSDSLEELDRGLTRYLQKNRLVPTDPDFVFEGSLGWQFLVKKEFKSSERYKIMVVFGRNKSFISKAVQILNYN